MYFQQRGIVRFMIANRNRLLHFGHILYQYQTNQYQFGLKN